MIGLDVTNKIALGADVVSCSEFLIQSYLTFYTMLHVLVWMIIGIPEENRLHRCTMF